MCFRFDPNGNYTRKEFLMGYPIINIWALSSSGILERFKWFPSEYLYMEEDGEKYCLTADKEGSSQIILGSTMMRQNDFIFDNDGRKIGIARSQCNDDKDMIITEQDYVEYGTTYGMDLDLMARDVPNENEIFVQPEVEATLPEVVRKASDDDTPIVDPVESPLSQSELDARPILGPILPPDLEIEEPPLVVTE